MYCIFSSLLENLFHFFLSQEPIVSRYHCFILTGIKITFVATLRCCLWNAKIDISQGLVACLYRHHQTERLYIVSGGPNHITDKEIAN